MPRYKLVMGKHTGSNKLNKEFNRYLFLVKYQQTYQRGVLQIRTDRYTVVSGGSLNNLNGSVKYFEDTEEL